MSKNSSIRNLSSSKLSRSFMKPLRRTLLLGSRLSRVLKRTVLVAFLAGLVTYCVFQYWGEDLKRAGVSWREFGGVTWAGTEQTSKESLDRGRSEGDHSGPDAVGKVEIREKEEKELAEEKKVKDLNRGGEDGGEESNEEKQLDTSMEVVIVATGTGDEIKEGLGRLLRDLYDAKYDGETVNLKVIGAKGRNRWRLRDVVEDFTWPYGSKTFVNATRAASGYFSGILAAWHPQRGDLTPALIIDLPVLLEQAKEQRFSELISSYYYRYLKSARARYSKRPDIAAYALQPNEVRSRPSKLSFSKHSIVSVPKSSPTYLYQSAGAVGAIAPFSADTWRTFTRWLEAHRSEWFLWPVIKGTPGKKDPVWKIFRGNHRAHWTLWWTRFCVEYDLFNLYPAAHNPYQLPAIPAGSELEALPRYTHKGELKPMFSGDGSDDLQRVVEKAQGKNLAMTVVNDAFVATSNSWICNVEGAGLKPSEILFLTTDKYSYEAMSKVTDADAIYLQAVKGGGKGGTGTSYGTPGYWLLMLERTQLISKILNAGVGLLAFETDQIWLRDPMPYIRRLLNSGDEVDMVGTLDSYNEIGGNFLYLNPTLSTRRLWKEVAFRFKLSYIRNKVAQRMKAGKIRRFYIENDQSILTKLVLHNETFRRSTPIVFRTLDKEIFVDGKWYDKFKKNQLSDLARSPVMINNNFIVGIQRKRERALKYGHWFWNEDTRECDVEAVKKAVEANDARANEAHVVDKMNADVDVDVDDALWALG